MKTTLVCAVFFLLFYGTYLHRVYSLGYHSFFEQYKFRYPQGWKQYTQTVIVAWVVVVIAGFTALVTGALLCLQGGQQ